jgi:hypothetical protein
MTPQRAMIAASRLRPHSAFFLACALSIIWASAAQAKTTTIDDSGTQALEPSVSMRWKTPTPSRAGRDNLMVGTTTLRVRLNVTPWLRRNGRIYLDLPAQQPGPISTSWITQGRFLPGEVHSGNRVLIYAGPIATAFLEDVMKFQFSVDGTLLPRPTPVTFHFEMDED